MLDHLKRHAIIAFFYAMSTCGSPRLDPITKTPVKAWFTWSRYRRIWGASDGIVMLFTQWSERNTA